MLRCRRRQERLLTQAAAATAVNGVKGSGSGPNPLQRVPNPLHNTEILPWLA